MWSADGAEPGKVAGEEVVHLYIRDKESSVTQPVKELKGFRRVTLAPGEKQTISFTLTPRSLSLWNIDMKRVVEPGAFDIMVGPDSRTLKTVRSEEHTSELQSLMRISYAVFCLKKKKPTKED